MNMNRAINMIFARPLVAFALAALLVVVACLSVAAPALAQEGARWHTTCKMDEWDDSIVCTTKSPESPPSRKLDIVGPLTVGSYAAYRCAKKADGTKEGVYQLGFRYGVILSLDSDDAETDSEGRTFYNVPMRWDDEPPVKSAFFWRKDGANAVLVWKNQSQAARQFRARDKLRIRPSIGRLAPEPTAFTYSLLGAAEAIAEAAGKCGF